MSSSSLTTSFSETDNVFSFFSLFFWWHVRVSWGWRYRWVEMIQCTKDGWRYILKRHFFYYYSYKGREKQATVRWKHAFWNKTVTDWWIEWLCFQISTFRQASENDQRGRRVTSPSGNWRAVWSGGMFSTCYWKCFVRKAWIKAVNFYSFLIVADNTVITLHQGRNPPIYMSGKYTPWEDLAAKQTSVDWFPFISSAASTEPYAPPCSRLKSPTQALRASLHTLLCLFVHLYCISKPPSLFFLLIASIAD